MSGKLLRQGISPKNIPKAQQMADDGVSAAKIANVFTCPLDWVAENIKFAEAGEPDPPAEDPPADTEAPTAAATTSST